MNCNRSKNYVALRKKWSSNLSKLGIEVKKKVSKLDPTIKAQWVEALRSGKYSQTTGALKNIDPLKGNYCHCCLGVLCEIIAPEGFKQGSYGGSLSHSFPDSKTVQDCYPNQNEMKKIGLYPSAYKALAAMNDGESLSKKDRGKRIVRKSFAEIANYIEKNL